MLVSYTVYSFFFLAQSIIGMDLSYVIRNLFIFNHVSTYLLRSYRRWLSICTLLPGVTAQPPVHHPTHTRATILKYQVASSRWQNGSLIMM